MGKIYHAKGVQRLVRNDLWRGRPTERFMMQWNGYMAGMSITALMQ